jgi:hypothetical protein
MRTASASSPEFAERHLLTAWWIGEPGPPRVLSVLERMEGEHGERMGSHRPQGRLLGQ